MLTADDFWSKWKANFTQWLDRNYKFSWEMSPNEWSSGVIDPYLLHMVREELGMWVRFGQMGRSGAILFDEAASSQLAHIEHENERMDVLERLQGLFTSEPPLKIVITYGDPKGGEPDRNREENLELVAEWTEKYITPVLRKTFQQKPEQVWLFIFGLEYDFRTEADWTAYKFSAESGKLSVSQLQ